MKENISATIEKEFVKQAKLLAKKERRSFSSILELALEQYLKNKKP